MRTKENLKRKIEKYKNDLNKILADNHIDLLDSKLLKLSKDLDDLIVKYYRENV